MNERIDITPEDGPVKTGVRDAGAVAEGLARVLGDTPSHWPAGHHWLDRPVSQSALKVPLSRAPRAMT